MRGLQFGSMFVVGVSLVLVAVGCGAGAVDEPAVDGQPVEHPASVSQAYAGRTDCNSELLSARTAKVTAYPIVVGSYRNKLGQTVPITSYQASVTSLLNSLASQCDVNVSPGTSPCADQYHYTYDLTQIAGAAGYYYKVTNSPEEHKLWIAIPIVDVTTQNPNPTYPGAAAIHTPRWSYMPVAGGTQIPTGHFYLSDFAEGRPDHTSLWYLVDGDGYNTSSVGGVVRSCIEIVDQAGNFLDYSAELEEHDPVNCMSCNK